MKMELFTTQQQLKEIKRIERNKMPVPVPVPSMNQNDLAATDQQHLTAPIQPNMNLALTMVRASI